MSCGLEDIEDLYKGDASGAFADQNRVAKKNVVKKAIRNPRKIKQENEEDKDQVNEIIPGTQKVFVKTFGCSHNISDSEFMMGQLVEYGYEMTDVIQDADICLVNSCTVKNPSQDAFINVVHKARELKKPVVVSGCIPQGDRNLKGIEDCSIIGVTQIDRIIEVVEETLKGHVVRLLAKKELPTLDLPKIRKNELVEIIPISTGCLGSCTYCKTRHARGKLGSYKLEAIVDRSKQAIEEGVKEIWMTSEDTGAYGRDIGTSLPELCRAVIKSLPDGVMLRIGMTNPPFILEHLPAMADILNHPKVFSSLHIPVQSGSNIVLDKMNREYKIEEFMEVADYLLARVPDLSICTDIICGFPTETEEDHKETIKLIEKYKFPILNISQFYPRPGTVAAKMQRVETKEVKKRSTEVTKLFESYRCYDHLLNTHQRVWIIERENSAKHEGYLTGHTKGYVKVLVKDEEGLLGKCVICKITETHKWHIMGEVVDPNPEEVHANENYFEKYERRPSVGSETDKSTQYNSEKEENSSSHGRSRIEIEHRLGMEVTRKRNIIIAVSLLILLVAVLLMLFA